MYISGKTRLNINSSCFTQNAKASCNSDSSNKVASPQYRLFLSFYIFKCVMFQLQSSTKSQYKPTTLAAIFHAFKRSRLRGPCTGCDVHICSVFSVSAMSRSSSCRVDMRRTCLCMAGSKAMCWHWMVRKKHSVGKRTSNAWLSMR